MSHSFRQCAAFLLITCSVCAQPVSASGQGLLSSFLRMACTIAVLIIGPIAIQIVDNVFEREHPRVALVLFAALVVSAAAPYTFALTDPSDDLIIATYAIFPLASTSFAYGVIRVIRHFWTARRRAV